MSSVTLKDRLQEDMKSAMKAGAGGKPALSVIRMVRAAVRNLEIERGHDLADGEVLEVMAREIKQRQESRTEFERGGRSDLVAKVEAEIRILQSYLPAPLTIEEIRSLVQAAIAQVGATGPRDMGKVMPVLLPQTRGRADGKLVSDIVKELLS